MKKIASIIIVLCFFAQGGVNAQTEKGKLLVGVSSRTSFGIYNFTPCTPDLMSVGFSTVKYKDDNGTDEGKDKFTSLNISPRIGYFVVNNLALGLDLNLSYLNVGDTESDYNTQITTFTAGPFVRYYIPTGKVKPFVEAGGAFGNLVYKWDGWEGEEEKMKHSLTMFNGGVGLAVPIGSRASFDTMISYNSLTIKEKEDNPENSREIIGTFGIRFGLTVSLGE
ncbi:MAG: outer membrane beta-barrel protein [Bacteroidales bacterium]